MKLSVIRDIAIDVAIELRARLSRTVLLIMAVALSVGALLASVGIADNAAHQIDADLAASTVNLVMVSASPGELDETDAGKEDRISAQEGNAYLYPDDTEKRLTSIKTVESAGRFLELSGLRSVRVGRSFEPAMEKAPKVIAVTPGYVRAQNITLPQESEWAMNGEGKVVFLGDEAAQKLGIPVGGDRRGLSVSIDGVRYSVAGFFQGNHILNDRVVLPYRTGVALVGSDKSAEVLVRTKIGAGSQVAAVVRQTIRPESPERFSASQVISSDEARSSVSTQMAKQVAWVGLFLVVLTILLITNSMIVSVTARTTEIGVRRALGSSRGAVSSVFLCEGGITGILGGLLGSTVSVWSIIIVALVSHWTAKLNLAWTLCGPVLGAVVGLLASAYPAWRAAKIQPAIAVRSN